MEPSSTYLRRTHYLWSFPLRISSSWVPRIAHPTHLSCKKQPERRKLRPKFDTNAKTSHPATRQFPVGHPNVLSHSLLPSSPSLPTAWQADVCFQETSIWMIEIDTCSGFHQGFCRTPRALLGDVHISATAGTSTYNFQFSFSRFPSPLKLTATLHATFTQVLSISRLFRVWWSAFRFFAYCNISQGWDNTERALQDFEEHPYERASSLSPCWKLPYLLKTQRPQWPFSKT